jgi:hypothetical protein
VPALPYRHHGGDRLHRGAQNLPTGSGYMTPDRRFNRTKPNRPSGRYVDACAATATEVVERGPSGQITAVTIARRLVWCGECLPIALQDVPGVHRRRIPRHSIPIALAAGGSGLAQHVFRSPARIPATESQTGRPMRPRRQAKNALRY